MRASPDLRFSVIGRIRRITESASVVESIDTILAWAIPLFLMTSPLAIVNEPKFFVLDVFDDLTAIAETTAKVSEFEKPDDPLLTR